MVILHKKFPTKKFKKADYNSKTNSLLLVLSILAKIHGFQDIFIQRPFISHGCTIEDCCYIAHRILLYEYINFTSKGRKLQKLTLLV